MKNSISQFILFLSVAAMPLLLTSVCFAAGDIHCGGYYVTVVGHLQDSTHLANVTIRYYFNGHGAPPTNVTAARTLTGIPNSNGRIYKEYNVFKLHDGNSLLLPMTLAEKFDTRFSFAPGNDSPGTSSTIHCQIE